MEFIVNNLQAMYSAVDGEERNAYFNKLMYLTKDQQTFFNNIFMILESKFDSKAKLSTSLFFKSVLNNMIIKREIKADERLSIFDSLTRVIFNSMFPDNILQNISPWIESLLFYDESDQLDSKDLLEILQFKIQDLVIDNETSSIYKTKVYLIMFKIITNVLQDWERISENFKRYGDAICKCAENLVVCIKETFKSGDEREAKEWALGLLEWSALNRDATSKIWKDSSNYKFIEYMLSDNYAGIFYDIIFLASSKDEIFFNSGDNKLDETIYSCKTQVIKIVSTLITIVKPHLHMTSLQNSTLIRLLESLVDKFLSELLELGQNRELESKLENN